MTEELDFIPDSIEQVVDYLLPMEPGQIVISCFNAIRRMDSAREMLEALEARGIKFVHRRVNRLLLCGDTRIYFISRDAPDIEWCGIKGFIVEIF